MKLFRRMRRGRASGDKVERGQTPELLPPSAPLTDANLATIPSAPHFEAPKGISSEDLFSDLLKEQAGVVNTFDPYVEGRPSRRFRSAPPPKTNITDLPLARRRFSVEQEREAGESRGRSMGSSPHSSIRLSSRRVQSLDVGSSPSPDPWDITNAPRLTRRDRARASTRLESRHRRSDEHAPTPVSSKKHSKNPELSAIFGFV